MNYYEHHIGDYDADTAHLTWLEDMAYTRLLRLYYRKEKPIPTDVAQACRLVRATSKDERKAVELVLAEFFVLGSDGWTQTRCEAEVAIYQKKVEHNQRVGKLGGRPPKQKTQEEPKNNPPGYFREPEQNPPQTPDPRQIPSDAYASGSASPPPPTADPPVPAPPEKPALTPVEIIFGYGLPLLTNAGTPEKQARSFLGGLRKHAGDEAVVNALRDCLKAKPLQPLEWLAAALPPDAVEGKKQPESFREKDARLAAERVAEFAPALARKTTPLNPANVFDIEAKEVTNVIAIQGC